MNINSKNNKKNASWVTKVNPLSHGRVNQMENVMALHYEILNYILLN